MSQVSKTEFDVTLPVLFVYSYFKNLLILGNSQQKITKYRDAIGSVRLSPTIRVVLVLGVGFVTVLLYVLLFHKWRIFCINEFITHF